MSNVLNVLLNFKPNLSGLDQLVSAYKARMHQVQAFNRQIQNGEVALRTMISRVGMLLGAAQLRNYARDAREAAEAQNGLTQALRRTGQVQYEGVLLKQANALEEVTKFSASAIQAAQRTQIGFRMAAREVDAATETILDWAEFHGTSATASAQFFGKALAAGKDELAQYGIELDTSKDRVTALIEAMQRVSGGAARAAIVNKEEHLAMVQLGREAQSLGEAVRKLATPFLQALIPTIQKATVFIVDLADKLTPYAPLLGEIAGPLLIVAGGFAVVSTAATGLLMVINPLRSAIVLLTGKTFLQLTAGLRVAAGDMLRLRTQTILTTTGLRGLGAALGLVGMAISAWQIGVMIGNWLNELDVGGMKIKYWAQAVVAVIWGWGEQLWGLMRKTWEKVKFSFTNFTTTSKVLILEFLNFVAEKFNTKLGQKLGWQVNTTGLKEELAKAKGVLAAEFGEMNAVLGKIDKETAAELKVINTVLEETIKEGQNEHKSRQRSPIGSAPQTNTGNFEETDWAAKAAARKAEEEAQLARRRELYQLETQAQQAEADGDIARADALRRQLREMEALADLGEDATGLIKERLDLEDKVTRKMRDQEAIAESQSILEKQLNRLQSERAIAEQRNDRTGALRILSQEQALIAQIIKSYETAAAAATTDLSRTEALAQVAQWQQLLDDLQRANASKLGQAQQNYQALGDGRQHFQGIGEGAQGGLLEYLTQVGTTADQVAEGIKSTLGSAVSSVSDGIVEWINGTLTFGDAARQVGNTILQSMLKTVVDMGVQWLVNKVLVLTGMTAIESAADAHRIARVAKENAAEAATLPAKSAGAVAAGISSFGVAVAFGAVALAAIMAAFGAFETGGKVRGGEQLIRVNESGEETVINAGATSRFGDAFMAGLNNGQLLLDALPADIASTLPMPYADAAGGGAAAGAAGSGAAATQAVNVAIFDRAGNARDWLESSEGSRYLHDRIKQTIRDLS